MRANRKDIDADLPPADDAVSSWERTIRACRGDRVAKFREASRELLALADMSEPAVAQMIKDKLYAMAVDFIDANTARAIMAEARSRRANGHDAKSEVHQHRGKLAEKASLLTRKASSYTMSALDWLWPERFAIGKLGLIGGLPDRGKGLICYDLIACVTNNRPLPCNEGRAPQG
jgi:hypothetical protein